MARLNLTLPDDLLPEIRATMTDSGSVLAQAVSDNAIVRAALQSYLTQRVRIAYLENALQNIVEHAPAQGEDCSYVTAKEALNHA